jgi:hypothetical protein
VSGGVCFFFFFLNKEARAPFIVKSHEALQRQNEGYKTPLHPKSETNLTKQLSKQYTNITWTPLKLHSTNKSSKYLCITKTLWNTQTTKEYTNKHKQEAPHCPQRWKNPHRHWRRRVNSTRLNRSLPSSETTFSNHRSPPTMTWQDGEIHPRQSRERDGGVCCFIWLKCNSNYLYINQFSMVSYIWNWYHNTICYSVTKKKKKAHFDHQYPNLIIILCMFCFQYLKLLEKRCPTIG